MKVKFVLLLSFCFFLVYTTALLAQSSELEPDELIINSSTSAMINAHYGLNGLTLQNFFNQARLEPTRLQVGDDLRFSILDGEQLSINTALVVPGRFTTLDSDNLTFRTLGSGLAREEWLLGRTVNASDPPESTLRIQRYAIGIEGGATIQTAFSIRGSDLNVGIGTMSPAQKLDVSGNARFQSVGSGTFSSTLNITADGTLTTSASDLRLKENISIIENPLTKTLALRGVTFNWKNDQNQEDRLGVIAQEVEEIIPELVFTNEVDGYKGVRYQEISALLIEAIKEQQLIIENQQHKIIELEKMTTRLDRLEKMLGVSVVEH